jgi:predicted RNA methylase
VHALGYLIAPARGGFAFTRPDGRPMPNGPTLPGSDGDTARCHDADITTDTIIPAGLGDKLGVHIFVQPAFVREEPSDEASARVLKGRHWEDYVGGQPRHGAAPAADLAGSIPPIAGPQGSSSIAVAMTVPPLPDDARQDLMLPFGPVADALGRDVVLSGDHADAVLGYCRAMGSKFGCPGYLRYLFGLPVDKALRSGYLITQRALRETTPHACAEEIARTALELLPELDGSGQAEREVLDVFAGVGQVTYSYAKAGCRVQAVDNDRTTVDTAVHNMALAGLAEVVEYRLADGPATLASAVNAGRRFSVVHLDPPWRGTYQYDLTLPFRLEDLAVNVAELVGLGLAAARLVVLNLPHNAASSQIGDLAALAGCSALVQYQYVADFPASFGQAPAYFFGRSGLGRGRTTGYQERRQRLTLGGQRVS